MKLKYSIKFSLSKLKGVETDLRIRMRVSYKGTRINIPLSCRVDADMWNDATETVLPKFTDKFGNTTKDINREIESYRTAMERVFTKYELVEERTPTIDEIKESFNEITGRNEGKEPGSTEITIQDVGLKFIAANEKTWTDSTIKKVKTTLKHLREYDKGLVFSDITVSRLTNYADYLLERKNLQNSTVIKQIKMVKWFIGWATEEKYNTNTDYLLFKPKLKTIATKVIFLNFDELMKLYNLSFPDNKQYLERVRDVFCFQCFTSLRYSDVNNLKRSDITKDHINIVTVKTNDSISIDLNDYSRAILAKYKDVKFAGNKALPVISNQKMNAYLKELGAYAGIDKPETITYLKGSERIETVVPKYELLSTHTGRRTFICITLALGIPAHIVMRWTGHSDYQSMKPYIGVADEAKVASMQKFNKK